jgi:hypothetical protein
VSGAKAVHTQHTVFEHCRSLFRSALLLRCCCFWRLLLRMHARCYQACLKQRQANLNVDSSADTYMSVSGETSEVRSTATVPMFHLYVVTNSLIALFIGSFVCVHSCKVARSSMVAVLCCCCCERAVMLVQGPQSALAMRHTHTL